VFCFRADPTVPSVHGLAKALVVAANLYNEQDAQARSNNVHFDEYVQLELPQHCGNFLIDIELLGQACEIAKGRAGKLRVDAFQASGETFYKMFVRQEESGNTHGMAVAEIVISVGIAVGPFFSSAPPYARVATGGLYGGAHISAPDVTVQSLGTNQGQPMGDSELGPLFCLEVESGNRSLPCLIRHLGMLLANFPHLNGVFGIKGEEEKNGDRILVLILIEWRTNTATGLQEPCVTELIDFGPDPLSDIRRGNAETALQLPLPPVATQAIPTVHGAGVFTAPFPAWMRRASGIDAAQPVTITLPATLLLAGARDANGAIITIPENALGAEISLKKICSIYFP
jgi:hypothetical protein